MYDIDIYTYKDKPETNSGKYNIYLLNEKGNDKYYFKKESHVTTYVDYLNPIIYKHIVGGEREKLPIKEGEKDIIGGGIIISDKSEIPQYTDTSSFRIKDSNGKWRYLLLDEEASMDGLAYKEIIPLGNNGEYLEMSSTRVPNISIKEIYGTNRKAKGQSATKQSEITDNTNQPIDDTNKGLVTPTPAQEKSKAEQLIRGIINSELGMRTPELAKKYLTANTIINADGQVEISNPTVWKYLSAAMESQGLKADKSELKDILDELC